MVNKDGKYLLCILEVRNPSLDVPDGCGTRHITAASFSTRKEVECIFTLSEETSIVRCGKDGVVIEQQYDPSDKEIVKNNREIKLKGIKKKKLSKNQ